MDVTIIKPLEKHLLCVLGVDIKGKSGNYWNAEGETGTFPLTCTLYKPVILINQHCFIIRYCLTSSTELSGVFRFPPYFPCFSPLCVCMSVCSEATGHSFRAFDLWFGSHHPCRFRKKLNCCFFKFWIFRAILPPFTPKNVEKWLKKPPKQQNKHSPQRSVFKIND